MPLVTLVGRHGARAGDVFIFGGNQDECVGCKFLKMCSNLNRGGHYRITAVREMGHECALHEGGVVVVEVEPVPFKILVPKKMAIEGSTISFDPRACNERLCPAARNCRPPFISGGTRLRIEKVSGEFKCGPDGTALSQVEVLHA